SCCKATLDSGVRLFRCKQCSSFLQCEACIRDRHAVTPLHTVKVRGTLTEWNGRHWVEARLSGGFGSLGLVYQIGHDGFACDFLGRERSMVVIDVAGIHSLTIRFCGCEKAIRVPLGSVGQLLANGWYPATTVDPETCATIEALDFFHLLNVVGNVNVHDFIGLLERRVDPVGLLKVPDRYKVFGRIARQYAYLQRAKRAGCSHKSDGLRRAERGSLAVLCWACPHDQKNLPENWRDVDPKYRFLYMLLLAMDANFRLKNRLRANEHQDPYLGSGLGYFVEENGYKNHIKNYVTEKDVSSCIAFADLLQKETRMTTGLCCFSVGGCVCARHGVVRPQGLGDLPAGMVKVFKKHRLPSDRAYANMDYILLSALIGVTVLALAISYDIACQWKINLAPRAKKIEETTTTIFLGPCPSLPIAFGGPYTHQLVFWRP
ncbi:hypothetical protein B0H14DRAFT_2368607, partial [Mycena olivaceomarginata]